MDWKLLVVNKSLTVGVPLLCLVFILSNLASASFCFIFSMPKVPPGELSDFFETSAILSLLSQGSPNVN